MQSYFVDTLEELLIKRLQFENNSNNIDTIVVGSSHGDYCFNTKIFPNSINFCHSSQDLLRSLKICQFATFKNNNIKNIICFYSIFSSGFVLEKSTEKFRILAYEAAFNRNCLIDYSILSTSPDLNSFFNGFKLSNDRFYFTNQDLLTRVKSHLILNTMYNSIIYLDALIKLSRSMNINLYFVIPPLRKDFLLSIPNLDINYLFRDLFLRNLIIFNFITKFKDNNIFFGDSDHMLPLSNGVDILTNYLYNKINK
jgi:hypothetical protein